MKHEINHLSFLVEVGSEELPPGELLSLRNHFHRNLLNALEEHMLKAGLCAPLDIQHGKKIECYATPRRISVRAEGVHLHPAKTSAIQRVEGPNLKHAFDADGKPGKAAIGFANKYQLDTVEHLDALTSVALGDEERHMKSAQRGEGQKNTALLCKDENKLLVLLRTATPKLSELLLLATQDACKALPAKRTMRWGAGDTEFVRPVRWVLMLFNTHQNKSPDQQVHGEVLGVATTQHTRGHPFMPTRSKRKLRIATYTEYLRELGVVASFEEREALIRQEVSALATSLHGHAQLDASLCQEVSALTEWPVVLHGRFEERYLQLPQILLVSVLQKHQRYFPIYTKSGDTLINAFAFVSNIADSCGEIVRGNERVIRPRLADAEFFYRQDCEVPLEQFAEGLKQRVFQRALGQSQDSMWDKTKRLEGIATLITKALPKHPDCTKVNLQRTTLLCKADLQSAVVGEFPELQGAIGAEYARLQGEDPAVIHAIAEHYFPHFATDRIPRSCLGATFALSDRLDTLFALINKGEQPTGSGDPLGLRRAALGIIRILMESKTHQALSLKHLLDQIALTQYSGDKLLAAKVFRFIMERLKIWLHKSRNLPNSLIEAVCAGFSVYDSIEHFRVYDCAQRLEQMQAFSRTPVFPSLVSLHKRLRNILYDDDDSQQGTQHNTSARLVTPNPKHFVHDAERTLFATLIKTEKALQEAKTPADLYYSVALDMLSKLATPVEHFFTEVMVMSEDKAVRDNRLSLLRRLEQHLCRIANFSLINIKNQVVK